MKLFAALLLSLALVASGRNLLGDIETTESQGERDVESPPYKVLNTTGVVEVREYDNATWAVAFGRNRWSTDLAALNAGIELAKYYKGGNAGHKAINRTVPVVGTVLRPPPPPHRPHKNGSHPDPPPKNGSHPDPPKPARHHDHHHHHPPGPPPPPPPPAVAVAGFIPSAYKGNPPAPDSPHVHVIHTNTTKVYVHKFGGWAISWVVHREIDHLIQALKDLGICAFKGKFFVASYDGPWKLSDRRNEIWWAEMPTHHHNTTEISGLEALDVEELFPSEFADAVDDFGTFPHGTDPKDIEWQVEEGTDNVFEATDPTSVATGFFTSANTIAENTFQSAVESA